MKPRRNLTPIESLSFTAGIIAAAVILACIALGIARALS